MAELTKTEIYAIMPLLSKTVYNLSYHCTGLLPCLIVALGMATSPALADRGSLDQTLDREFDRQVDWASHDLGISALAQLPSPGPTPAVVPPAGYPGAPWNGNQGPGAGMPYPAYPMTPPTGQWVMVWLPYGPGMSPGAEAPGPGGYVPAWVPPAGAFPSYGQPGTGTPPLPAGQPYAAPMIPWGYSPAPQFPVGQSSPPPRTPWDHSAVAQFPGYSPPAASAPPPEHWQGGNTVPLETWQAGASPPPLSSTANAIAGSPPLADLDGEALTAPNLNLQGLYVLQGDQSSARVRLSGDTFLTPNVLVGGALDLTTGPDLTNQDGVQLTELYLATALPGAPGVRFRLGQLDLTSYFDRNSFAKDIARDFFNATFHTNPALIAGANATASRPGGVVQWAVTDNITANAAVFSSSPSISDFALDGFAGEVGLRTGDLIVRGTYISSRDTQFQGTGDRLEGYGVNAEWFIPQANIGLFGRYGRLNNSTLGFAGDTYSFGVNALDVFMPNDRLGLAYGRNLPTSVQPGRSPDVLEAFYDFEVTPNIRLGLTFQQRDQFRESYAGFRIRGNVNLLPGHSFQGGGL